MNKLFAQAAPPMPAGSSFETTLLMIVLVVAFMYFLVYRPESKRRKQLEAKRAQMKKGDKLIIAGGIVAEFVKLQGSNIVVKLFDGAKMEVLPLAVQDIQVGSTAEEASTSAE